MSFTETITIYSASTGAPLSGLSPTFLSYSTFNGSAITSTTAPSITDNGDGQYYFTHSFSSGLGIIWTLDCGSAAFIRYMGNYVRPGDFGSSLPAPISEVFFAFSASTGGFLSGLSPTFSEYNTPTGTPITAPSIINLGSGAYCFTPDFSTNKSINYIASLGSSALNQYQSRLMNKEDWDVAIVKAVESSKFNKGFN